MQELAVDTEQVFGLGWDRRGEGLEAAAVLVKLALNIPLGPLQRLIFLTPLVLDALSGTPGVAPVSLGEAGGCIRELPGQFPLIPAFDDLEGHFVDQIADLPGAVLILLPLVAGVRHLWCSQILDRLLQEEGLCPMLVPGGNRLFHGLKDFLLLRLAGL